MKTNRHPLIDFLTEAVGAQHVSDATHAMRAYAHDSSVNPPGPAPGVAVAPETTEQVAKIVGKANDLGVSVMPRGGGANIHGYTAGREGESVLLDMTRMRRVVHLDPVSRFVTAEAGIVLGELSRHVEEHGLFVHTVGVPQYVDSLGGVMSGQEGGGQNIDNNPNWRYVLGFKVVLPNGAIVQTGSGPGTNVNAAHTFGRTFGAPDATGLFLGDCGAFGIKTEVTLQVFPDRKAKRAGGFLFESFDAQWRAVSALMDTEPYVDNLYTQHFALAPESTQIFTAGEMDGWALLYCVRARDEAELAPRRAAIEQACRENGGEASDLLNRLAAENYIDRRMYETGDLVSAGMWQWSESICLRQEAPKHYLDWRDHLLNEVDRRGLSDHVKVHSFIVPFDGGRLAFHASNLFIDDTVEGVREAAYEIEEAYRKFVVERGCFTENNQGRDADNAARHWSPPFRAMMQSIKQAIDPKGVMNPGAWDNL